MHKEQRLQCPVIDRSLQNMGSGASRTAPDPAPQPQGESKAAAVCFSVEDPAETIFREVARERSEKRHRRKNERVFASKRGGQEESVGKTWALSARLASKRTSGGDSDRVSVTPMLSRPSQRAHEVVTKRAPRQPAK